MCFACRERGHTVDTCPKSSRDSGTICYYCGETGHTTSKCIKAGIMGDSAFK